MNITIDQVLKDRDSLNLEIKRYLKYPPDEVDQDIDQTISSTIEELKIKCEPKYIIKTYPIVIDQKQNIISLTGTNLTIQSKDLTEFLNNSNKIAILAATLGIQIDKFIKSASYSSMLHSLIIDATASAMIELVCNYAEDLLREDLQKENCALTSRYSPGYGDLELKLQPQILDLINATKSIGLYSTEQFLLIPSKSVTAFMGIKEKGPECSSAQVNDNNNLEDPSDICKKCPNFKGCYYLKKGEYCEYRRTIRK